MTSDTANALCHESVTRLAGFLYAHADGETVRTLEAIAAAVSNRVQHVLTPNANVGYAGLPAKGIRAQLFISALEQMEVTHAHPWQPDDPVFACCMRIARRATNRALRDPTRGATDFRKLGEPLPETFGSDGGICIGAYVFFTEAESSFSKKTDVVDNFPLALV